MANNENLTTEKAKARRFGQPNGNPRNPGGWKKSDTPRYKLEQLLKLSDKELEEIAKDKERSRFEQVVAAHLHKGEWKTVESMINQVYGMPKQQVEQTNIEPPKPLSPRKQKKA